ncbi:L-ascorbate oxidase like [Glycine soja]|nr:L-ascorbate oxidase like [Glycine soja]
MGGVTSLLMLLCLFAGAMSPVKGEDPYFFFTWNVTYGTLSPAGVPQQVILINNEFPGPNINSTSNNNIVVNVFNNLDEPLLFHWAGVQQRKNSWEDGVAGTNCPIQPGTNYTYHFQVKDQIGSFFYYPSLGLQRAAGGFGNQEPKDYYMVASTRFTKSILTGKGIMRYTTGKAPPSPEIPEAPVGWAWSLNQFRSFRWNLTASAARPNPQGSYHYGQVNITRTVKFINSVSRDSGKLRYAINGVSHVDGETPIKLAEYFGVPEKVFKYDIISDNPSQDVGKNVVLQPNVIRFKHRTFIEIIFENPEKSVQSYHLNGYAFFAVAIEPGTWTPEKRKNYNLLDAVSRHTMPVFPKSWAAILLSFDNVGVWNLRSELAENRYLGQQLYISVLTPERSLRDEYNIPEYALLCGVVKGLPKPEPYH